MRFAMGSDERNSVTDFVLAELRRRGHDIVRVLGPAGDGDEGWVECGRGVAETVANGDADQGIVFCSTGTGVSIAANKVPGVRAALCTHPEQARGARRWNDANVLAMSLQMTSPSLAHEILDAWLDTPEIDPSEARNIEKLRGL